MTVLAHNLDDGSAEDAFLADAQRYRRELLAHCYRMTGSLHDAEDLVQETYLRAWKSYKGFQGKSSVRTWLYRIATNRCLTALDSRQRRPLPTGLGALRVRIPLTTSSRATRCPGWSRCPTIRWTHPPSSGPASRCGWRSSRPCNTSPPGNARCSCCVRCSSGRPLRSRDRFVNGGGQQPAAAGAGTARRHRPQRG